MRQILRPLIIILVAMGIACWAAYPPEKKLRLGKDLSGGVSMVYTVQIEQHENATEVLAKVIDALKKRVDPDGLMTISMVAQGRDRIEISMPLPGERVKALRKAFEDELIKLGKGSVSEARIDQAVRTPAVERAAVLEQLGAGNSDRLDKLKRAA